MFAGAYYVVTVYVAGFVTGVQHWWQGIVNWWDGLVHGIQHPFGLDTLPIGAILMARRREERENSGSAAWLILGILFIFFMLGALYVTWLDYMIASAFQGLTGHDIWGSLLFPLTLVIFFLVLAIVSLRKSHELG